MLVTLLIFLVLLAFIFLGFPIFMALLITGIIFIVAGGNSLDLTIIKMFGSVNSLSLLAIPFFVTAGNIIMRAKITDKLVNFANAAVGFLPGGLGHVNVLTSAASKVPAAPTPPPLAVCSSPPWKSRATIRTTRWPLPPVPPCCPPSFRPASP